MRKESSSFIRSSYRLVSLVLPTVYLPRHRCISRPILTKLFYEASDAVGLVNLGSLEFEEYAFLSAQFSYFKLLTKFFQRFQML